MGFEEFKKYVAEHLTEAAPEVFAGAAISIREVDKNNGKVLTAVSISRDDAVLAPVIYLEGFYKDYQNGKRIEDCVREIAEVYATHRPDGATKFELPEVFEDARADIRVKLINYELNRESLVDRPHFSFGDLAACFIIKVRSPEFGTGSIDVTQDIFEIWGVSEEELLEAALVNMKNEDEICITGIDQIVREMRGYEKEEDFFLPDNQKLYVLTNKDRVLGASLMLDDETLGNFAKEKDKDVFILPSSIHELILVPDFGFLEFERLKMMVKDVNRTLVPSEDVLSDSVYIYRKDCGRIFEIGREMPLALRKTECRKCS